MMEPEHTEALRNRGLRVTPQRAYLWRLLAGSGAHFTAEEMLERAQGTLPGLEASTVYRTLETLKEAGLVTESRPPEGPRLFEARPPESQHPHLLCERCGVVTHPEAGTLEELAKLLVSAGKGFDVRELHVTATGLCAECTPTSLPDDGL